MKNGGQAFPTPFTGSQNHPGMTLRDYLAAKAMQSLIIDRLKVGQGMIPEQDEMAIAKESYSMADSMLRAKEAK